MSIRRNIEITCPKCGKAQSFLVYDSVCVSLFSGHKEKELIKQFKFFKHKCILCGLNIELSYPCLYHDTKRKLMIWLVPVGIENEQELLDDILKSRVLDGYTTRLVASDLELIDKIEIFDEGLDDRVIEICKILMYGDICKADPKYEAYELNAATYHKNHGVQHTIMYHSTLRGEKATFALQLSQEYYDNIRKAFSKVLSDMPCEKYEVVNENWAYSAVDLFKQQR